MYGFCGNSTSHCDEGCQSGPCSQAPTIPVPEPSPAPPNPHPGSFKIVGDSGVPAMHAALMPNGRVVFLDKVENYTRLKLADGYFAYSSEYDPATNEVVPLSYKTNAFCAGGAFLANGTLLAVGGNGNLSWLDPTVMDGWRGIRYLTRSASDNSSNGANWVEPGNQLDTARWYPSVQTLPDGTIFVASGSLNGLDPAQHANNNPTYEILDQNGITQGQSIPMEILVKSQPYYMYPFIHLLPDGNLFIFVSKSSEIFNFSSNSTMQSLPDLPGEYRTYPNTGTSVLLPLSSSNNWSAEILICGGGAYQDLTSPTDASCGRITPLSSSSSSSSSSNNNKTPTWELDSLPQGRTMLDNILLPDGTILFLNGAHIGSQGFGLADDPLLQVLIYEPLAPFGSRWTIGANSTIPRLYHSIATLLLDGSVLVAGSNPNEMPVVEEDDRSSDGFFQTEFRTERYFPLYFSSGSDSDSDSSSRPGNVLLSTLELYSNHSEFQISFQLPSTAAAAASASAAASAAEEEVDENKNKNTTEPPAPKIQISLYHNGFITHSLHMNQRMLFLDFADDSSSSSSNHPTNEELDHPTHKKSKNLAQQKTLRVRMPPTPNLAPPGPYVVYVVVNGVPAVGQMVMVRTGTEAGTGEEEEGEGGQRKKGEAGKRLFGKERRSKVGVWGVAGLVGMVGRWL